MAAALARLKELETNLIHEYLDIDDQLVFAALDNLNDLRDFAAAIAKIDS